MTELDELKGLRYDNEKYMRLILLELGNIRIQLRDIERGISLGHTDNQKTTDAVKNE